MAAGNGRSEASRGRTRTLANVHARHERAMKYGPRVPHRRSESSAPPVWPAIRCPLPPALQRDSASSSQLGTQTEVVVSQMAKFSRPARALGGLGEARQARIGLTFL